jgi:predicted outer membrane protein
LPILLLVFEGGRDQTSVISVLITVTGTQSAGLLVYTAALATRFKSKSSEFGVPLHRWVATGLVLWLFFHVLLVLAQNPDNVYLFLLFDAPARAAAGIGALVCLSLSLFLGEFRALLKIRVDHWRLLHTMLAWTAAILAFSHIVWIDQLVNDPAWVILFVLFLCITFFMWLTRTKGVSKSTDGVVPKIVRWVFIVGGVLAVIATLVSWKYPDAIALGYSQHELGPVGPADRDMLFKVKQAGLWEMPVGQEAMSRAATRELRDVGEKISAEHFVLDVKVTEVADQLGIPLPTEPSPDQKRWMEQITESQGIEYDLNAVLLLRQAHGKILPLLAQVRAGSRNELIRSFASEGMEYVHRHITYLESTGLINYADLPEPPPPSPYQQPEVANYFDTHDGRTLFISSVIVAVLGVFIVMLLQSLTRTTAIRPPKKEASTPKPPRHAKAVK